MGGWFLSSLLCAIFVLSPFCLGETRTYWVHSSCTARPEWSAYLQETFDAAKSAANRLSSDTDTDFANVFKRIFHFSKDEDTDAHKRVVDIMSEIGKEWKNVAELRSDASDSDDDKRRKSDVRIYCNNGERWVSSKKKNRMRDTENKLYVNHKGCSERGAYAFTATDRTKIAEGEPEQNNERSTVDLCDKEFTRAKGTAKDPAHLSHIPAQKDLSKLFHGIGDFKHFISLCLLHEFTHIEHYNTEDVNGKKSYGWANIVTMDKDTALKNADNYAYLGLWALLADRSPPKGQSDGAGYTLPQPWDNKKEGEGKQREEDTVAGKISLVQRITTKWVQLVTKRVAKVFVA